MNNLGKAIKKSRESLSLTQGQLSVKSGVPRSTITALEQGTRTNPTIATILQLATAFRTTPDVILRLAGYLPAVPEAVPGEQEALALFRSLSPIRRECIIIILRALARASAPYSIIEAEMPHTKEQLFELINEEWYNFTEEQRARIRNLVLDAVQQQQAAEEQQGDGGKQKQECRKN